MYSFIHIPTAGFIKAQLILRLQQLIMCINNNFIYNYDAHIQSPLHLHSLSLGCGVLSEVLFLHDCEDFSLY